FPARRLRVDQRLHFVTPDLAFARAADVAQVMQRAEDFGEALQIALIRRAPALRRLRVGGARGQNEQEDGEDTRHQVWRYARRLRQGQGISPVIPAKRASSAFSRVCDALWRARAGIHNHNSPILWLWVRFALS